MDITVTQENLNKALSIASRVASTRTQLPILGNILLRTDKNRLLIAATNLEMAITKYIGAKVTKQIAITVPAKLMSEFISNLPSDSVNLSISDNKIKIESGVYKSTINGVAADDFPELPSINESSSVKYTISSSDFKQAVLQTIITASTDSTRPALTGVYWHTHRKFIYLAATDGYRLSEKKLIEAGDATLSAIVPTQTLQEAVRAISDDDDEVEVLFDETQVRFRIGDVEIISRLIDGEFPNYRQLIPNTSESVARLSKDEFIKVTKIAGLFSKDLGGSVTITADQKGSLSIHSIASELGENTSEAKASVTKNGQVTLNSKYLNEALAVIDGQEVEFGFSGKIAPTTLKPIDGKSDYTHIIMPLKS